MQQQPQQPTKTAVGYKKELHCVMAAISLSVISKNNEPLYVREFDDTHPEDFLISEELLFGLKSIDLNLDTMNDSNLCSTRHQFVMHAALDRLEQLAGPPPGYGWRRPGASGVDGMFVSLCTVEDLRVYAYVTTTRNKILLVVEDDAVPEMQSSIDSDIKSLLSKIHQLYIEDLLNPFKDIGSTIISKRFDRLVYQHISDFNQSEGMI